MATHLYPFRTVSDFSVRRAGIIIKKDHKPADAFADMLCDWLKGKGITATINQIDPDLDILVILGGDGTLLHVADQAARHSIPVIGINLGNLGFLTELTEQEALPALEEIISGAVTVENRMMLKTRIIRENKPTGYWYALNEVVISKGTLDRVLQLSTRANTEYITTYKADGLIFSTPTGSTAYNLSAGGPLVYPGLASILVTPICPFMLSSRPVLLPPETKLSTRIDDGPGHYAKIIIDGQSAWDMQSNEMLEIEAAEHPLQLIISPHRDYFSILRNKLHWGIPQGK
ncbi:MAG: NAD(+)/NADH kinase [Proteobacteria bacterium]|jgi:NAD+ kinase|nr:NAD(+)/NADH kinase [Desulfocapsa sp.]MBU3944100.1 NAD(+)/NADH kinase [Pseudomonadota bacterium]MCG2743971.1 NAD(+)/NADH kinase [Desulfobacteraceae bacterium]MBU3984185.1 NAD(+)/NADH kinase [Pseudomonadota bacterium]MBU4029759.1 NAD(+)/NADH kinase [Pseudomonadota bacterium]